MSLAALLRAARADPRVWSELAKVLLRAMRAYFRRLTTDDEAQDLAQTVVLVAWQRLPTLESEEALDGWLYGIARNLWREHTRATLKRKRLHDEVAVRAMTPIGTSTALRYGELAQIIQEEIERLPPRLREVLEHQLAEEDPRVLMDLCEIARSTVRSRRTGAKTILRKRVLQRARTPGTAVRKLTAASTPSDT